MCRLVRAAGKRRTKADALEGFRETCSLEAQANHYASIVRHVQTLVAIVREMRQENR